MALFEELARLMAGEMTKLLQGNISALKIENRYLEGVLSRVTNDLFIYRDRNLTSFSEDNQGLKEEAVKLEEAAKLKEVEEKLEAANKKVLEQKQQLKRLPESEKGLKKCKKRAEDAEARESELKARVKDLKKAAEGHLAEVAWGEKEGFDRAVQIACVLVPTIKFKYLDGRYEAKDGKIYEKDEVVYATSFAEEEPEAEADNAAGIAPDS